MSKTVEDRNSAMNGREPEKNWFAVFTAPRHEKRIEQHCRVREIETFLPLCRMRKQWKDGSKGTVQIPLFPSYIFARFDRVGRVPLLEVPGVISIVGGGRESMSISETYIQFLKQGIEQGKIEPHPYLASGTKVRIRSGVMTGMEGILLRTKTDFRVVLTLEMIMKSIKIEVGLDEIEPVGTATCPSLAVASEYLQLPALSATPL